MKTFRFKAITTDSHECHKCGKTELKKVVMVETVDADGNGTGDITPMGTTCAAKALGMNKKYKTPEAIEAALTAKAESKAGYEKAIESAKKQASEHNDHVAIVKVSGHYTAVRERALNANPNLYGTVYKWIAPTDAIPPKNTKVKSTAAGAVCITPQSQQGDIPMSPIQKRFVVKRKDAEVFIRKNETAFYGHSTQTHDEMKLWKTSRGANNYLSDHPAMKLAWHVVEIACVPRSAVRKIAMVGRHEKHLQKVNDSGAIREWVGIGWISTDETPTLTHTIVIDEL